MKSYAERNYSKTYLQNLDLQKIGVYYSIPVEDLTEDAIKDFDIELVKVDKLFRIYLFHQIQYIFLML